LETKTNGKPMGAGPMKFQKGHKLAKGGKRNPPGGRPSTRELKEIARAADRAREKLERKFEAITDCYTDLATDREHEATTRHAMENYVLPVAKEEGEAPPLQVTFLQFSRNPAQPGQNSSEPWTGPSEVKSPILVSDNRNGDEWGGQGVAPVKLQFANFSNGKRRK